MRFLRFWLLCSTNLGSANILQANFQLNPQLLRKYLVETKKANSSALLKLICSRVDSETDPRVWNILAELVKGLLDFNAAEEVFSIEKPDHKDNIYGRETGNSEFILRRKCYYLFWTPGSAINLYTILIALTIQWRQISTPSLKYKSVLYYVKPFHPSWTNTHTECEYSSSVTIWVHTWCNLPCPHTNTYGFVRACA